MALCGFICVIFILLALIKFYVKGAAYDKNTQCTNKVIIITGATSGVGKETARELAKRGGIIYLACRDLKKAEKVRVELINDTGNYLIIVRYINLASLDSIRNFVEDFRNEQNRLDILINNAGVMYCSRMMTEDGFEQHIGVNHFGHFLLTSMLLDLLQRSAPSRILNITCLTYGRGTINKFDLNFEKKYEKGKAYCQSKLANMLFTRELARRIKWSDVTVNAIHPGRVDTDLFRHIPIISYKPIRKLILWPFFNTAANGAQTVIYAALDPELKYISGKCFANCKEKEICNAAKNVNMARWLWEESEKLTDFVI